MNIFYTHVTTSLKAPFTGHVSVAIVPVHWYKGSIPIRHEKATSIRLRMTKEVSAFDKILKKPFAIWKSKWSHFLVKTNVLFLNAFLTSWLERRRTTFAIQQEIEANPTQTLDEAFRIATAKRMAQLKQEEKDPKNYHNIFPVLPSLKNVMAKWKGNRGYTVSWRTTS